MYRCISPHGMRHGTPYAQSPKRPGDVDVSPLVPSLLAGLLRLRRLSLHTLVHGRLKPYKVQYLGSSGILDTARSEYTHTLYDVLHEPIRDTERLVCGSLALASAPLYWFPQSQNYFPGANVFSSVHVYPNFWNFEDLTRGRAFPKINLEGGRFPRNKIGHVINMPKLHSVLEHQARF